jgi:hypothetical protein
MRRGRLLQFLAGACHFWRSKAELSRWERGKSRFHKVDLTEISQWEGSRQLDWFAFAFQPSVVVAPLISRLRRERDRYDLLQDGESPDQSHQRQTFADGKPKKVGIRNPPVA